MAKITTAMICIVVGFIYRDLSWQRWLLGYFDCPVCSTTDERITTSGLPVLITTCQANEPACSTIH
jgi:hypothetical protein